jgi:23S rRNA (cytidine1920-2'-O)/16S rRNA (cytidine1409-2'-O)-methyltransferase
VKPQFEAGRHEVGKRGLITDPAVHAAVVTRATEEAEGSHLVRIADTPSPITGATGNREFFLHLVAGPAPSSDSASTPSPPAL